MDPKKFVRLIENTLENDWKLAIEISKNRFTDTQGEFDLLQQELKRFEESFYGGPTDDRFKVLREVQANIKAWK